MQSFSIFFLPFLYAFDNISSSEIRYEFDTCELASATLVADWSKSRIDSAVRGNLVRKNEMMLEMMR